ncbi:Peptide methionine sulfoxide reductase MsrA [Variovorax boronicumulans]|uniref:peptide-methionine (S)-S-oxide reductase MsrA n=1 Tax=Variovorax boronicumulans TaxID=436515 RepID=UPI000BB31F09|nr:peptide-methionine (S)-S-oxide reductase MsrA [Variovorax boronicumulans]PBI88779.1 Peptide methionine sulfoxide reductase MsrA [Variovorax boronicumulans]
MENSTNPEQTRATAKTDAIVLGGGCFWCTEAVFDRVQGVLDVESGYSNGQTLNPSYEQICTGRTGHAEVVKLEFDPAQISLRELLEIFFVVHDPTTLNRQGNDVGTQYRSGIYTTSDAQKEVADSVIREIEASKTYSSPVVTEVAPLANYSTAEAYHQDYFLNHPNQGYCAFVVGPKVEKFQKTFASRVKA